MVRACLVALLIVGSCQAVPAFVKEKVTKTKKSFSQLKQESAEELEALLTQTSRMIASLAELQEQIITKLREIITTPADSFFAKAKPSEWLDYCTNLSDLTKEFEKQQIAYCVIADDIRDNFQKG